MVFGKEHTGEEHREACYKYASARRQCSDVGSCRWPSRKSRLEKHVSLPPSGLRPSPPHQQQPLAARPPEPGMRSADLSL